MGNFQKLRVWQLAKNLAVKIYKLTKSPEFSKDFGLKDQIQRAAVSIPANISEGDETLNLLDNECNVISVMLNKLIKARTP